MKIRTFFCVAASLLLLVGSSTWEGAAGIAPEGVLPASGRYIATNSFPRNTVVDITNIETNRSTRVIVAGSLDSPGLIAVVSREAAELIGMRSGSVSRIRMIQPSDPIAYLRFTEGLSSGIPEYDSGNVINEDSLLDDVYRNDTYRPSVSVPETPEPVPQIASPGRLSGPSYILEPEWSERSGRSIVDLPGFDLPPVQSFPEQRIEEQISEPPRTSALPVEQESVITEQPREETFDEFPIITGTMRGEVIKDVPEFISGMNLNDINKAVSEFISEAPREEVIKDVPEFIMDVPRTEIVKQETERVEQVVEQPKEQEQPEYVLVPVEERPPENGIYGINPEDIIQGAVIAEPERETARPVPPVVTDSTFSVPRIYELDRGWYYVQVAAVDSPESVERMISQIDRSYRPVVYRDGDNWYRILLGPLNQGESAAVLQRFRSIGYSDAFVRQGGR
jgi:hypothetical protein